MDGQRVVPILHWQPWKSQQDGKQGSERANEQTPPGQQASNVRRQKTLGTLRKPQVACGCCKSYFFFFFLPPFFLPFFFTVFPAAAIPEKMSLFMRCPTFTVTPGRPGLNDRGRRGGREEERKRAIGQGKGNGGPGALQTTAKATWVNGPRQTSLPPPPSFLFSPFLFALSRLSSSPVPGEAPTLFLPR